MSKRILVIQGHPDPAGGHFCHALARAYLDSAKEAGHEVRTVDVAHLNFPLLHSRHEWEKGTLPVSLMGARQDLLWAEHVVFFFPLWLGTLPALLKGFLEQVLRPDLVIQAGLTPWRKVLGGRSARLVVTMGMPAFWYRWVYFAHGLRGLELNVLSFAGIRPIRESLVGLVESPRCGHARWLARMAKLGWAGK
jgi:putative NADPH-quinone reductase